MYLLMTMIFQLVTFRLQLSFHNVRFPLFTLIRIIIVRNATTTIGTLGSTNIRKALITRNLCRFWIPVPHCTVTWDWSVKRATFVHKLAQCPGGMVTVDKVVGWSGTGHFLGKKSRLVDLKHCGNESVMRSNGKV